jgi:hypothetical protein
MPILKMDAVPRTTILLNDKRGSEQYHSMNSSIACRYPAGEFAGQRF